MKIVQGFVNIFAYTNNIPGQAAKLGELSTNSRTYSKEKGEYVSAAYPGYQLITFSALNFDTGSAIELPTTIVNEILQVVGTAMSYARTRPLPYTYNDFMLTLQEQNKLVCRNLVLGELVYYQDIGLPSRLSWKSIAHEDSEISIWLADEAFADQYAGYEIDVAAPLENLNDFFKPFLDVGILLDATSVTELANRIQIARDINPPTTTRIPEFLFVNRYDRDAVRKTNWGVLVYGKEGDYTDAINDAITNWLVENSSYTYEQWELIFPDIFRRTEMTVLPRWDKLATANQTDLSSLYSSILNLKEATTFAKSMINYYSSTHVEAETYVMFHPHKTIGLTITNGNNNALGKKDFKEIYWDYLPVASTTNDFGRMHAHTQQMSLFLSQILLYAETATYVTPLPAGFRRMTRGGVFFVASIHNGINFLVAARNNAPYRNPSIGP